MNQIRNLDDSDTVNRSRMCFADLQIDCSLWQWRTSLAFSHTDWRLFHFDVSQSLSIGRCEKQIQLVSQCCIDEDQSLYLLFFIRMSWMRARRRNTMVIMVRAKKCFHRSQSVLYSNDCFFKIFTPVNGQVLGESDRQNVRFRNSLIVKTFDP